MDWYFYALLGPLLYAITNHIDKILLARYFREGGVGTLMLFSSLLAALALPLLYWIDPRVLVVAPLHVVILCAVGVLSALVQLCYFVALRDEEASVAIIFYQLVPVFGYVLGYIFLSEQLTTAQLLGMATVIAGTSLISIELGTGRPAKLRRNTCLFMTLASFFWALESVLFKSVALEENLWRSLFWSHSMLAVIGVGIFVFGPTYRSSFVRAIKTNSRAILSLNFANESLYMLGSAACSFAYLQAPIALVLLANSFQSLFVLIIGVVLTLYFPRIVVERLHPRQLLQKSVAIAVTAGGTYILLR